MKRNPTWAERRQRNKDSVVARNTNMYKAEKSMVNNYHTTHRPYEGFIKGVENESK